MDNWITIETRDAIGAFAALAQETRLAVVRLLVAEGPDGLPAGEVAARVGVPAATLSFHLSQLENAGLVTARRQSRHIFYAADYEGLRRLMAFLAEDCCQGRPELCGDAARLAGLGRAREDAPQES